MAVEIRELGPADAEALLEIRRLALRAAPHAFLSSPEDDVISSLEAARRSLEQAPLTVTFGAFAPAIVGMAGVHRARHRKAAHKASLFGMFVRAEARGQGIGRGLLAAAIDHARGLDGLLRLDLTVSETAPAARRLYERFGFQVWGSEPQAMCVEGRLLTEHHMTLALADQSAPEAGLRRR